MPPFKGEHLERAWTSQPTLFFPKSKPVPDEEGENEEEEEEPHTSLLQTAWKALIPVQKQLACSCCCVESNDMQTSVLFTLRPLGQACQSNTVF